MRHMKFIVTSIFFGFVFAANSHAEIISTTDFEDGRTGSISSHSNLSPSGNAPQVVKSDSGVPPRSGSYMMKTYLNRENSSINYRTEATLGKPGEFYKGQEYWMGISVFIPKNWSMDYGGSRSDGIVFQFHGRSYKDPDNWRKILPLTLVHTESGLILRNHTFPTSGAAVKLGTGNLKAYSKTIPYKLGQWMDFVMHIKWSGAKSDNDTNGFLKVWVDGEQVLSQAGQNYFGEHDFGPYFKFGLYNSAWKYTDTWVGPSSRTLYHDELRVGDANSSYNEVAPGGIPPIGNVSSPPSPPLNLQAE